MRRGVEDHPEACQTSRARRDGDARIAIGLARIGFIPGSVGLGAFGKLAGYPSGITSSVVLSRPWRFYIWMNKTRPSSPSEPDKAAVASEAVIPSTCIVSDSDPLSA